jgi:AbrB family looped-hinge helix DNA binding protein
MEFMATKTIIDKKGRIALPKSLMEKMHIKPGDALLAKSEGDCITLHPIRQKALLKKELGIWVYQGEPSNISMVELIDAERKKRLREILTPGS